MLEWIRNKMLKKRRLQVAYWDLVERSEDHLRVLEERNERRWRLSETRVALDLAAGRLLFTRPDGGQVSADIQTAGILGFNSVWSWTWEQPQIAGSLQAVARQARDYGQRHGMDRLATAAFVSTEVEAWDLTAVACLLGRAEGAYRLRIGNGLLHVVFRGLSGDLPQQAIEPEGSAVLSRD